MPRELSGGGLRAGALSVRREHLACAHHLLVDPGLSAEWKVFNTSYAMYLAVLASMIHGLTVPGSMEVAQRAKGYTKGDRITINGSLPQDVLDQAARYAVFRPTTIKLAEGGGDVVK